VWALRKWRTADQIKTTKSQLRLAINNNKRRLIIRNVICHRFIVGFHSGRWSDDGLKLGLYTMSWCFGETYCLRFQSDPIGFGGYFSTSSSSVGSKGLSWVSACSTVIEQSQQEGFTECRCQRHVKPPTWRRNRRTSVLLIEMFSVIRNIPGILANDSYGCENKGQDWPEPIWATIPATALFAGCD
jgi:hypothetical protein